MPAEIVRAPVAPEIVPMVELPAMLRAAELATVVAVKPEVESEPPEMVTASCVIEVAVTAPAVMVRVPSSPVTVPRVELPLRVRAASLSTVVAVKPEVESEPPEIVTLSCVIEVAVTVPAEIVSAPVLPDTAPRVELPLRESAAVLLTVFAVNPVEESEPPETVTLF